jgi:hypothetical protein
MPIKKLGLNFCLNKPHKLIYIQDPVFTDEDADKIQSDYIQVLNEGEYMGI